MTTLWKVDGYRRKLYGWLSYAFASEVFVIVSLTLFLPICLEQFARDNGFLLPDKTLPCSALNQTPGSGNNRRSTEAARCVVKLGWAWIDTASFSLYTYSLSVALQALTVISMGGIADLPHLRKPLLLCFAALGSLAATLFLFLSPSSPVWYLSSVLAIVANVGFGASIVALNAYLPSLAQESPTVVSLRNGLDTPVAVPEGQFDADANLDNSASPLLPNVRPLMSEERRTEEAHYQTVLARETSRISLIGIALGYGAGICLLIVALIPVTKLHGSTFALRLAIGSSGIWWALFSIPAAMWLPSFSAPESVEGEALNFKQRNLWREVVAAWIRLISMLRWAEIKRLRNTFKFLAAWFLLSDGFTTITSIAVLFAKTTLHMSPSALILVGVLTPLAGIVGSLVWPVIQRKYEMSSLKVLITLVIMGSLVPAYGCLGFITQGHTSFGGLTTPEEMFVVAIYFGSVYGAFQGYARALYAKLLPPGEAARWYGLYSITDKSSSFIGPLVVGLISDLTGSIRSSFFFLVILVWAAVPILMHIDTERGWKDAQEYQYQPSRIFLD